MFSQHEINEITRYLREVAEIEKAPMHERKEAAAEFYEAMAHDPALVAERVGWLLDGNYGQGSYLKAHQVMAQSKRANKIASLTQMTAVMEWRCPFRMAAAAWKKLTPAQKAALDRAVQTAMDDWKASR